MPRLQRWIAGYRVDFLWPEYRFVLEADGRVKYTDDEAWEEKRRLLALERTGHRAERVVWADLFGGWPETSRRLRPYFRLPRPSRHLFVPKKRVRLAGFCCSARFMLP